VTSACGVPALMNFNEPGSKMSFTLAHPDLKRFAESWACYKLRLQASGISFQ
jgi:hypothetical protein